MLSLGATIGLLNLLGDATRVRLLSVLQSAVLHSGGLQREGLTVAQITSALDIPQSRVSTHLGRLREAGLVRDERRGASTLYSATDPLPEPAASLWASLRAAVDDAVLDSDRERAEAILASQRAASDWIDAVAGELERHYSPGRTWAATARGLTGLVRVGDVLDIGSGDGVTADLLAARAKTFTCLDRSDKMLDAARRRLERADNVRFELGDMHELPFADRSFDQVLLFNVLTYSHSPARAIGEAARVLRPEGGVSVITLDRHLHRDVTGGYRHVNDGFSPEELAAMLEQAGLCIDSCAVTSRERRAPHFQVVTAFAHKTASAHP
jgi:SAM-dependent methyltransferase